MNTPREKTQMIVLRNGKRVTISVIFNSENPTEEQQEEARREVEKFCKDTNLSIQYRTEHNLSKQELADEMIRRSTEPE